MTPETPPEVLNFDEAVKPKLPTGLNVLTILTFVGCAWELYSTVNNFIGGKKALEEMEKAQEKLAEAPAWARKLAGPEVQEMMLQSFNNKVPIFYYRLNCSGTLFLWSFANEEIEKTGIFPLYYWRNFTFYSISSYLLVHLLLHCLFTSCIFYHCLFILLYSIQRKHLTK